jgi:hypothetical protein
MVTYKEAPQSGGGGETVGLPGNGFLLSMKEVVADPFSTTLLW